MEYIEQFSHENGDAELKRRGLSDFVSEVFNAPIIKIGKGTTNAIRDHVREKLLVKGWSNEIPIDPAFDLTVFSIGQDVAFQIQTRKYKQSFL